MSVNMYRNDDDYHPHCYNMRHYSEDAMKTRCPWEWWQWWDYDRQQWRECNQHPDWNTLRAYRRKPPPVRIEGEISIEAMNILTLQYYNSMGIDREAFKELMSIVQEE